MENELERSSKARAEALIRFLGPLLAGSPGVGATLVIGVSEDSISREAPSTEEGEEDPVAGDEGFTGITTSIARNRLRESFVVCPYPWVSFDR